MASDNQRTIASSWSMMHEVLTEESTETTRRLIPAAGVAPKAPEVRREPSALSELEKQCHITVL